MIPNNRVFLDYLSLSHYFIWLAFTAYHSFYPPSTWHNFPEGLEPAEIWASLTNPLLTVLGSVKRLGCLFIPWTTLPHNLAWEVRGDHCAQMPWQIECHLALKAAVSASRQRYYVPREVIRTSIKRSGSHKYASPGHPGQVPAGPPFSVAIQLGQSLRDPHTILFCTGGNANTLSLFGAALSCK